MAEVVIYTGKLCGFCSAAKKLLSKKGAQFTEIDVTFKPEKRQEMISRTGGRSSVPQIFIGDIHVGGCDDLFELDGDDKLDDMLAAG